MEFENLITLIKTVSSSELTQFSMKEGDFKISMGKEIVVTSGKESAVIPTLSYPTGITESQLPEETEEMVEGETVKAPLVGTFYSASAPEEAPFIQVGDVVKKGQTLGIIEAMKLMNEIECEYDGVVEKILAENGQMVEYGQPLFVIKQK
ncbi:MAG: acetyl-CoA carboxylase biotin carboxyl carrier protein [Oliverpabstia sp.]|nr:acetyl-CoA carboxylase biotin carboxyl carrier protein [Oliverpabstia sp.]